MKRYMLFPLLACLLFATTNVVYAKNMTQYGHDQSFWRHHVLIHGKVTLVEQRGKSEYHISFRVTECIPAIYSLGDVVKTTYDAPHSIGNFGNLTEGLKAGDTVLVLLRPDYGFARLPNGEGESFAMMPNGAPLYRVVNADDQLVNTTLQVFRACSIGDLHEKTIALGSILEQSPDKRMKSFIVAYLDLLILQTETELKNTKKLLETARSDTDLPK